MLFIIQKVEALPVSPTLLSLAVQLPWGHHYDPEPAMLQALLCLYSAVQLRHEPVSVSTHLSRWFSHVLSCAFVLLEHGSSNLNPDLCREDILT